MTTENEDTARRYYVLYTQRITCRIAITSAQSCLDLDFLAPHWPTYERLRSQYQARMADIDAQVAAMDINPVYAGGRREDLQKLKRGYAAQQVTPREFGARLRWLRGGR